MCAMYQTVVISIILLLPKFVQLILVDVLKIVFDSFLNNVRTFGSEQKDLLEESLRQTGHCDVRMHTA